MSIADFEHWSLTTRLCMGSMGALALIPSAILIKDAFTDAHAASLHETAAVHEATPAYTPEQITQQKNTAHGEGEAGMGIGGVGLGVIAVSAVPPILEWRRRPAPQR